MPASRTFRRRAMDTSVTLPAFAKVNLTLDILGRRPDGYHGLHSIVAPLSLHDDITVTVASAAESLCGVGRCRTMRQRMGRKNKGWVPRMISE